MDLTDRVMIRVAVIRWIMRFRDFSGFRGSGSVGGTGTKGTFCGVAGCASIMRTFSENSTTIDPFEIRNVCVVAAEMQELVRSFWMMAESGRSRRILNLYHMRMTRMEYTWRGTDSGPLMPTWSIERDQRCQMVLEK